MRGLSCRSSASHTSCSAQKQGPERNKARRGPVDAPSHPVPPPPQPPHHPPCPCPASCCMGRCRCAWPLSLPPPPAPAASWGCHLRHKGVTARGLLTHTGQGGAAGCPPCKGPALHRLLAPGSLLQRPPSTFDTQVHGGAAWCGAPGGCMVRHLHAPARPTMRWVVLLTARVPTPLKGDRPPHTLRSPPAACPLPRALAVRSAHAPAPHLSRPC